MIAYIEGKFSYKSPAQVFVDVHGIGYEVNISLHTYSAIQDLTEGRLFTHLQVKEDSHTLFGFFEREEKEVFLQLTSVSGVGAATARMMLSSMKPDEVISAISQGNTRLIESVKGIGKKTAERLILELRDKVGKQSVASISPVPLNNTLAQDAFYALMALGISKVQAEQAINKVLKLEPETKHLEEIIKKALKAI
ncbi:MAG: Holliday junction branch migration protein RuvA [Chitinophagaceae bacterium]|nr:Holliday junction branch migration protein RuvA [Bacteroidota bacterium]MCC6257056.1 Holliday junction branch migration protein RuvA [Chitinophagaceae bacterium]MCW5917422.1 Holliday junction branch migration protein RuvA [Ferruginibacter sp.]